MKIKELMTKKVITATKDTKIAEVAKLSKSDIGFVPSSTPNAKFWACSRTAISSSAGWRGAFGRSNR